MYNLAPIVWQEASGDATTAAGMFECCHQRRRRLMAFQYAKQGEEAGIGQI
jgi:hypothetical protein